MADEAQQDEKKRKSLEEREQMTELERIRHSCAHILATAILRLWPDAQFAYGPPVENGFYYDVELQHRISPEDFERIEEEMRKEVKANNKFEKITVTREQAIADAKSGRLGGLTERVGESVFKLDLLDQIPEDEAISYFQNGEFIDLCAGPHVMRTGNVKAFKLTHVASAYYKGDETRPQLQRIYGTAFKNKTQLEEFLKAKEEAKERDHRRVGRQQELFAIDDQVGQGLVLWMPKGATVRQALQDFISEELAKQGYDQVFTPHIGKLGLYRTSGHFPYYRESQFPPIIENEALEKMAAEGCSCSEIANRLNEGQIDGFLLKPMNCPMHIRIYAQRPRSYRELPVRLAEFGTVYRWEQSGELGGMTRVRGFTQDDAHLFVTPEQVGPEVMGCLDLVKTVLTTLGMNDYRVRVSLRDPASDKYVGDPANWDKAEAALRDAVQKLGVPYDEVEGEAAFYGPKIDFLVKDVIGREWQLGTVQVDYNLPERFDLHYIGSDNQSHRPVMIHRAPFGSMERFVGVLIEHFNGNFPLWLAPEQVRVMTLNADQELVAYGTAILNQLKAAGVRSSGDFSSNDIKGKVLHAEQEKVHTMLVIGGREMESGSVAIRLHGKGRQGVKPREEAVSELLEAIARRKL
ncbi:MAG: threonine--tRNA ligase [Verrucomicrobiae bacterium]|jgi:threonyl-tRNA synthetase|nr:threonine--tRNA ligase [Verrucomicrobiae bacterium]